jgi:phage recombination protein Bet
MTVTTTTSFEVNSELLRNTLCKDLTTDEFDLFIHMCKHTRLDPILKQIYAIKRGGKMTTQTSIDGFRLVAERTGKYSPGREATYSYDGQGKLVSATAYIKKMTDDGTWHEVSATAFWEEYVQSYNGKPAQFWLKMPHVMLTKCAESGALRKAFPADLSGLYTKEEMGQAESENEELNITPLQQEVVAPHIPDITEKEVNAFIESKFGEADWASFKEWFYEVIANRKSHLTKRKMIEAIEKNFDHTKLTFEGWKMAKAGM